jgi:Uma2 family endonuclease
VQLLADHEQRSAPRFTYDRGELEIMSPIADHERYKWALGRLVEIVAEHLGLDCVNLGSTTFRREELQRGFEPDGCFYFRHAAAMARRDRIDLRVDPPPELVIEIDMTHSSLQKLPIFAEFGVPEVWRYDGERLQISTLQESEYVRSERSGTLPFVTAEVISALLREGIDEGLSVLQWSRRVRAWVQAES